MRIENRGKREEQGIIASSGRCCAFDKRALEEEFNKIEQLKSHNRFILQVLYHKSGCLAKYIKRSTRLRDDDF